MSIIIIIMLIWILVIVRGIKKSLMSNKHDND
jgi:amino acid transporter